MVIAACSYSPALAQNTVKVGVVLTSSGQFADAGAQLDNGIKTYMQQHGDTVAGTQDRDHPHATPAALAPDVAKRLAQELVVRDNVDILAGWVLTPNALAAADVSAAGEEVHGGDECRNLDHHDPVTLSDARFHHVAADHGHVRALGGQAGRQAVPTPW